MMGREQFQCYARLEMISLSLNLNARLNLAQKKDEQNDINS